MRIFQLIDSYGKINFRYIFNIRFCHQGVNTEQQTTDEEGFRILELKKSKSATIQKRRQKTFQILPARETRMQPDQIWSDVWPGVRTFHPATVPLPLRQGVNKRGASPAKWANAELMKVPNFLHLTPPAIKKHCEVLKKFCTKWPENLINDEQMVKHFPLQVITMDYCYSSPSIRNPLARIVSIKFPLSELQFDQHSKDKFLRLIGERYDPETDLVTIVTDKCPLKMQNYEYALYLLTAVYHESWTIENWEKEKSEADLEYFNWDNSRSKENVLKLLENDDLNGKATNIIDNYRKAVVDLFDKCENEETLAAYKDAARTLLFANH